MRVLFSFAGGNGHFLPLVPLARAVRVAGHDVVFAGQPAMIAAVEAAGFAACATGGETLRSAPTRTPLLAFDAAQEDRAVRDGFAGRVARDRAAALLDLCGRWRPDLLVCDELDFGAMVAAERLGLPHASVLVIAAGALVRPDLVAEPLTALRAEHGLIPDPELAMRHRHLVLSPVPPSFRDPACPLPATARPIRPAMGEADEPPPAWLAALPADRPIVYATLGTVFHLESGDLLERVVAGLRDLPVSLVVTTGHEIDPASLGPQPAHVRIERYVPQSLLLPRCRLMVSQAGSGGVTGALAHGVPMVLLPIGADQPANAARCAALGVARVLDPVSCSPAAIGEAARAVLADPAYGAAAGRMAGEIAAMPDPAAAVPLLERLAGRERPDQPGSMAPSRA
ncbi:MAG: glycosyltransferase family 1 protein [Inquilinus limosus]|uniref:Glycosyltransferase family 1 protein n=1 Tax=Inquilinus limosus TaxID=171674 RepID=A0A952KJF6_9PROT|nr:glycosyltransferase family 1 protein [Inquilinus limosus]